MQLRRSIGPSSPGSTALAAFASSPTSSRHRRAPRSPYTYIYKKGRQRTHSHPAGWQASRLILPQEILRATRDHHDQRAMGCSCSLAKAYPSAGRPLANRQEKREDTQKASTALITRHVARDTRPIAAPPHVRLLGSGGKSKQAR